MEKTIMLLIIIIFLFTFSACNNEVFDTPVQTSLNIENTDTSSQSDLNTPTTQNDFVSNPKESEQTQKDTLIDSAEEHENIMYLHIGEQTLTATLAENSSVTALRELLAAGSLTLDMQDYGGFEKVGSIGTELPQNDASITGQPGDLILYQGNSLVILYGSNTWSYTRIGKINDITQDELKDILGNGSITVTLTLTGD